MYGPEDYYAYHASPEFHQAFLKPIASWINQFGDPCLDVGCGRGWLGEHVTTPYCGVEGSVPAVDAARRLMPCKGFHCGRFEDPAAWGLKAKFGTIVFGNIIDYAVKPNARVLFIEMYVKLFEPKHLIVFELLRFDSRELERRFKLLKEFQATANVKGLQEIKKHRKVQVYEC